MITTPELHKKAAAEGIRFDQAEKDYVILWILYGLFQSEFMPLGWAFKGGTCLRHCYYPGYRFSEDLDFSCQQTEKGLEDALFLLTKVAAWIEKTSGIAMEPKNPQTIPGDFQVEIPMQYTRGGIRRQGLPHVKLHLTFDERILTKVATCSVKPLYSDLTDFEVTAYSKEEIVVEKMRALLQQQKKWPRPRDLYDLWFILHQAGEKFHWEKLKRVFVKKCQARGINPDLRGLISENLKERNKSAWDNQLGPLMKNVPEFDKVWNEWIDTFQEIFGRGEGWLNKY